MRTEQGTLTAPNELTGTSSATGSITFSPPALACRGIRGATTAIANTAEDILEATDELMRVLIHLNDLEPEDVVSAIFTTTPDLTATFPALAARNIGWTEVPLICSHEMTVPGSLQKAVRVLLHVNTTRSPQEIRHVYLKGAQQLRPEWAYADEQVAAIRAQAEAHTVARG
ncbi:MAG TPA: chorismate mutase [Thermomicrobiales bacterium]|nr:chorismate mutase [Thermomicrobiales bacterium]